MAWMVRIAGWWDDLRDSLWFLPAVVVAAAVGVAAALIALEPAPSWVPGMVLFGGTPDGARTILSELAGATITVVGLVFSMTVVALQMASSQFTPRLLRTFLRDRGVQAVLSVMIASAVFDVIVLSTVRSSDGDVEAFVPRLAVSAALLLAGAAVALLVYFLHHVTQSLRVDVIIRSISRQTVKQIGNADPGRDELPDQDPPDPPDEAFVVTARTGGYLQLVDEKVLADVCRRLGYRVRIRPILGEWVSAGTTLAWAWPDGGQEVGDREELRTRLHGGLHLGKDRTESADLGFGIRQLQDIALRALSTGVNDPSTAAIVTTQLSVILVELADRPLGASLLLDDDGQLRVAVPRPTFPAFLELVIGPIRRNATKELAVLQATVLLLTDVAERVADSVDRAASVEDQLDRLVEQADLHDATDRAALEQWAAIVRATLRQGTRPSAAPAAS
jgi:uncharacterized membrane protein